MNGAKARRRVGREWFDRYRIIVFSQSGSEGDVNISRRYIRKFVTERDYRSDISALEGSMSFSAAGNDGTYVGVLKPDSKMPVPGYASASISSKDRQYVSNLLRQDSRNL